MNHRQQRGDATPTRLWWFGDGKPGHENQALGLIAALRERLPIDAERLEPLAPAAALQTLAGWRPVAAGGRPGPHLVVGAGHRTHLSVLAVRRRLGGHSVVLMRPSLPLGLFDLCVIPEHDDPPRRPNVLVTPGVLNRIRPGGDGEAGVGLVLVGGPSPHVHWDDSRVVGQVHDIVGRQPAVEWTLASSRRTPEATLTGLAQVANATLVPHQQTDAGWLPARLARAGQVWVSADGVSMVYEALTCGAGVGLIEIEPRGDNRVVRGLQRLEAQGAVVPFSQWRDGTDLQPPGRAYDAAGMCADWICRQWLNA